MGEAKRRKDTGGTNTHDMAATRTRDKGLKEQLRDLTKVLVALDHLCRATRRMLAKAAKETA